MGVSSSVPERACPRKGPKGPQPRFGLAPKDQDRTLARMSAISGYLRKKVGRQAVAAQSIQSTSTQSKSGTVVVVVTRVAVTTPVNDWVIFPVVSYASSVKVPEK